jgi:hypothetical protein
MSMIIISDEKDRWIHATAKIHMHPAGSLTSPPPTMLQNLRLYFWHRRRGLAKLAGVLGGLYLVTRYMLERLEEMREALRQEKLAKEK